jgi:hypothetical protein
MYRKEDIRSNRRNAAAIRMIEVLVIPTELGARSAAFMKVIGEILF